MLPGRASQGFPCQTTIRVSWNWNMAGHDAQKPAVCRPARASVACEPRDTLAQGHLCPWTTGLRPLITCEQKPGRRLIRMDGDREHPVRAFNNYSSNLYGSRDQLQAVISPSTVQSSPGWPDEWLATVLCKSPKGDTAGFALPRRGVGSISVNQQLDSKKHGGAPFYWTGCPLDVWRLCRTPSTESRASAMPLSLTG